MIDAAVDRQRASVGSNAEQAGVPERDKTGVADEHVKPEREDRIQQDLRSYVDVITVADPQRQCRQCGQSEGKREPLHNATRPNRPCGRTTRMTSIGRNSTT